MSLLQGHFNSSVTEHASGANTSTIQVRPGYSSDIALIDLTQLTQLTRMAQIHDNFPERGSDVFSSTCSQLGLHPATTTYAGAVSFALGGPYR